MMDEMSVVQQWMVLFSLISTDDAWMACASFVTVITGVDA
jgi:hypothetical protein